MKKLIYLAVGIFALLASCANDGIYYSNAEIRLPSATEVQSILFTDIEDNREYEYSDAEWITAFMSHLESAIPTGEASVQDMPFEEDLVKIDIKVQNNITTLFFYEEEDRYFVEQPYQGIYEIGIDVEDIIDWEKLGGVGK